MKKKARFTYEKKPAKALTAEQIELVVKDCIVQGRIYDDAMNEALFGAEVPRWWGEWPTHAKKAWDVGAELYLECRPVRDSVRQSRTITKEQIWGAMDLSMRRADLNMRMTWRDIGFHLNVGSRDITKAARDHGFLVLGKNGDPSNPRELVCGPCIRCGTITPAEELDKEKHACTICLKQVGKKAG